MRLVDLHGAGTFCDREFIVVTEAEIILTISRIICEFWRASIAPATRASGNLASQPLMIPCRSRRRTTCLDESCSRRRDHLGISLRRR